MAIAKMAPISIISEGEELERIESDSIMSALVVEDYQSMRKEIEEELKELGYSVDSFASPKEAAMEIVGEDYQLSVIDIRFSGLNISGDDFVRKNIDILGKGKIVAFTAFRNDISIENAKFFNKIITKGDVGQPLYEYAEQIYQERRKLLAKEMKEMALSNNKNIADPDWELAEKKLIDSLNQTENKNEKMVWYKGSDLSANELLEEVKDKNSSIGQSHIRMMLNWIKRKKNT